MSEEEPSDLQVMISKVVHTTLKAKGLDQNSDPITVQAELDQIAAELNVCFNQSKAKPPSPLIIKLQDGNLILGFSDDF